MSACFDLRWLLLGLRVQHVFKLLRVFVEIAASVFFLPPWKAASPLAEADSTPKGSLDQRSVDLTLAGKPPCIKTFPCAVQWPILKVGSFKNTAGARAAGHFLKKFAR